MPFNRNLITQQLARAKRFFFVQLRTGLFILSLITIIFLSGNNPLFAQMIPGLEIPKGDSLAYPSIPVFTNGNLEMVPVFLDGKIIGTVSTQTSVVNKNQDGTFKDYEAATRSYLIHSKIQRILDNMADYSRRVLAKNGITDLEVQKRELEKQLQIKVTNLNNTITVLAGFPRDDVPQVIYSVTQAEIERPRIVSSKPEQIAERAAKLLRESLIEAWQARQPNYLLAQAQRALVIFTGLCIASLILLFLQKFLTLRRKKFEQWLADVENNILSQTEEIVSADDSKKERGTISHQLHKLALRQRKSLNSLYRSALFWSQWLMWLIGIAYIGYLFYFSRPLSNWIIGISIRNFNPGETNQMGWAPFDWLVTFGQEATLGTPLLILLLLLMVRLAIKIGDAFADSWAAQWTRTQSSQRKSLRAPTLVGAFRGWLRAIIFLILGGILAHHLHQLGAISQSIAVFFGFLSFAVSLASQNLLKDLIAGLLILWEDQYAVGDVIVVGDQAGLVEQLTLRITQLRNLDGELITIPNGTIEMVKNLSSEWSRVNYAVEVNYDADVEKVMTVMTAIANEMYQEAAWQNLILEPPEILGVDNIAHTGILIRLIIKTQPLEQWAVAREYRLRLKNAFDKEGISIGIPQQNVYINDSLLPSGT